MKNLYAPNTANYPRLKTDTFFADYGNVYRYDGEIGKYARFIEAFQLLNPTLWKRFVDQFRLQPDAADRGWRGEYWGKMMRGACFAYSCTRNPELYQTLTDTVWDMLITTAKELSKTKQLRWNISKRHMTTVILVPMQLICSTMS